MERTRILNEKPDDRTRNLIIEKNDFKACQLITENVGGVRRLYIKGVFSEFDIKNQNGRVYPESIMKPEIIRYMETYVKTGRAFGECDHPDCFLQSFQTLTENGWKKFEEINIEADKLATINIETNELEYKKIEKKIDEHYSGDAYKIQGRNINTEVTPNHKFLLIDRYGKKSYHTIEEIYNNRKSFNKHKIAKTVDWVGTDIEFFNIGSNKYPIKPFMSFMGFWLAESHVSKSHNNIIGISQNEGLIADEFREILKQLPFTYTEYYEKRRDNVHVRFSIKDKELYNYLIPLGKCYNKYIPSELKQLSSSLLEELLEWFIKGDGRDQRGMYGRNRVNIFATSEKLIEDLHEIVIKIGGSGNWTEYETTTDYMFADHLIEAKNKKTLYQLNISTTGGIYLDDRFLSIKKIKHNGNIFCFTMKDNHNFYVKQNNKTFWSGNCNHIQLDNISHRIVNLWIDSNKVYGKALIGGPKGDTIKKIFEMGGVVGVSSRSLGNINHRNEVTDLQIIGWDIVHEPSVGSALMETMTESKNNNVNYNWTNDNTGFLTESVKRELKIINNNMLLDKNELSQFAESYMKRYFESLYNR